MFGISYLILLLLEVFVLTYMEYISWKTIYTPLTCLMLPYLLVLLISIAVAGHFGFVDFYYPSIAIWTVGLPLFAIPSYILSLATIKYPHEFNKPITEDTYPKSLGIISVVLSVAFILHFISVIHSSMYLFGTDDFAEDFAGHGIWAHLREMVLPLLIIAIYFVKKKSWFIWCVIVLLLTIQLLYMVKGAVIIAAVSGMCIRLYAGKMHLSTTLLLKVFLGSFGVFILIYMVIPLMGNENGEANMELFEFVIGHFFHYFTSGTLGLSYDMELHCADMGDFEILVAPFINIYKTIVGDPNLISPVNPLYLNTGITLTNVRTFFGTMYIYCNSFQFIAYTLIASTYFYSIKLVAMHSGNVFIYTILCYYCGLMAMGWFEFYLFHLSILEVPIMILIFMLICKLENKLTNRINEHSIKFNI